MLQQCSQQPKGGNNPTGPQLIMDKHNVVYPHDGILFSLEKDEFMSFAGTQMKLETSILSKLTQE